MEAPHIHGGQCCHHHPHQGVAEASSGSWHSAAHATLHCLTGCAIGEILGLAIGVHFVLGMWPTMLLATLLAYVIGFSLALFPLMRREQLVFAAAFRVLWLGELISIGVMEAVMNGVDYLVGGVGATSLASPIFYLGLAAAIPAGFLAAWPVNYWLLKQEIKDKCH